MVASGSSFSSFAAEQTDIGQADQATLENMPKKPQAAKGDEKVALIIEMTTPAHLTEVAALELAFGSIDNAGGIAIMFVVEANL